MLGIILVIIGAILVFLGIFIHIKTIRRDRSFHANKDIDLINPSNDNVINPELESLINLAVIDGVLTDNEKNTILKKAVECGEDVDVINKLLEQKLAITSVDAETKIIDKIKEKGDAFEKYVVSKFDKKYFTLKEWAGDKYINGIYAETTTNPDLVFCFSAGNTSKVFAVECKYRSQFKKDGIIWAGENQVKNYRNYQRNKKVPVYIAIGVGGRPDDPDELFLVPLDKIFDTFIPIEKLRVYRKSNFKQKNIYFDAGTLKLC